jgi:hypothetical protein
LISWHIEQEKSVVSSLESIVKVLLSWSVLIIGGFIYLVIREKKKFECIWLLIPIFFLFILSIYFGFSCIHEIINAEGKGIPVSKDPIIDHCWWKHLQTFQQAIFLSAIFVLWNIPSLKRKKLEKEKYKGGQQ